MSSHTPPAPPQITGFGYVRPLGSGGFADVYQYEQDMPRRVVAVKVLRSKALDMRERSDFEAEADAMARLSNHPSIVSIYTAGISADGRPYLAMEFCPDSMRERTKNNPAPLYVVLDAGVRLAGALETAHRAGILHRDIKPSNVLLTATGRPTLTDFGISMLQGGKSSESREQALSIPWSSPEVVTGKTIGTVASEIWSLGATLYTFAAGVAPFEHADRAQNTQSKMTARITRANYTPIGAGQGGPAYEQFNLLMHRALQLLPEQRFVSMREFAEAMQQLQRLCGFDVTPLDLVEPGQFVPAAVESAPRGPVATTVRSTSRAQQRQALRAAQQSEDRDGVLLDQRASPVKAGVIGGIIALVAAGLIFGVARAAGWIF